MGSLTQSLLSASADKTAEAKSDMEKSQADPLANKPKKSPSPAQGTDTSTAPAKKTLPKLPGAAKMGAIGAAMGSFHDGGTVPETGPYILHEGEEVIPAKRASDYRKVYLGRKSKKD